jgi:hypothetical protein
LKKVKRLICTQNKRKLAQILKGKDFSPGAKSGYLDLGEEDSDVRQLLKTRGIAQIVLPAVSDDFRKVFLQEYIDLVGSISRECNSREWWCTAMASKNRFTSSLPILLSKFLMVIHALESAKYDTVFVINAPWQLHVSLQKAADKNSAEFLCAEDKLKKYCEIGFNAAREMATALFGVLKDVWRKYRTCFKLRDTIRNLDRNSHYYVVKTFIYGHSFAEDNSYKDAFFGSLPDYLKKRKEILIYANILGDYKSCVEKISKCTAQTILPLEVFLSPGDLWRALISILFCRIEIQDKKLFCGYDVTDILNNEMHRTHNGIPFDQLLHYYSTRRLLGSLPVDNFLLTYENNPWERMCILAIKENSPATTITGYQHTVVPQASANMFPSRREKDICPLPDQILTVGEAPREIMERYGSYGEGKIAAACGLRFEYLFKLPAGKRKRSGQILVALEGIFDVYKMVNYVLKELAGNDLYRIRIRTHPVLPVDLFRRKIPFDLKNISNVHISGEKQVKDDIEWSDMVIYWGTTVALEAVSMGKPVIHYAMDSVLSYDPLFECEHFKRVVSDVTPLAPVIEEIYSLTNEQYESEQMKAKKYLSRYFYPVTDEGLNKFLPGKSA